MQIRTIEKMGMRVLTSRQLAEAYESEQVQIQQNFSNNRKRFIEGKHYILLIGEELKRFKRNLENFEVVAKTANRLYLWTEKGALLHAKSLNTDKAWEAYNYLVDFYFREKEVIPAATPSMAQPPAPPVELSEWEKRIIAYNCGVILGVYRAEISRKRVDALAVYNLLCSPGEETVASLLFWVVCHAE